MTSPKNSKKKKFKCHIDKCIDLSCKGKECVWWHNVRCHAMPITFFGTEKLPNEIALHLGYFWEMVLDTMTFTKKDKEFFKKLGIRND